MTEIRFRRVAAKFNKRRVITIPVVVQAAVEKHGPVFDVVLTPVKETEKRDRPRPGGPGKVGPKRERSNRDEF